MVERALPRSRGVRRWPRLRHPRAALAGGLIASFVVVGAGFPTGPDLRSVAPSRDEDAPKPVRVVQIRPSEELVVRRAAPDEPRRSESTSRPSATPPAAESVRQAEVPAALPEPVLVPPPPRPVLDEQPPRFAGVWAPRPEACQKDGRGGLLPVRIDREAARAGSASCRFQRIAPDGDGWKVAATCSDGAERWKANVRLVVSGSRLTWSSERGVQTYTRCGLTRTAAAE